jgi:hypothetical protein
MVSTADWTGATRWPHIATRSARDAPVATRSQNARRSGGTARGYQALFASLAMAVLGAHGPTGGRPGALPLRLMVAALA